MTVLASVRPDSLPIRTGDRGRDRWLAGAIALGAAMRLAHIASADFPLNDGGLFAMMIDALRANRYVLPGYIPWGPYQLPFAYPPFAFYLAAVTGQLTGVDTITLLRILPFLGSVTAILAFAGFAQAYLGSHRAVVAAVLAYALMPQGYLWMISGGGLTRSFGVAFSLLALHQLLQQFRHPTHVRLAAVCVASALTVLTHPESATLFAASAFLLILAFGRTRAGLLSAVVVALATLALTAPWWGLVLSRYGVEPFLAGGGNAFALELARALLAAGSPRPFAAALLILLIILLLAMLWLAIRSWFVLAWLISILLFSRNFLVYSAPVVALLLTMACDRWWLPLGLRDSRPFSENPASPPPAPRLRKLALAILVVAMVVATNPLWWTIPRLSRGERDAMAWIGANTPPSTSVLILGIWEPGGAIDHIGDWFPALSGRRGLDPPQGTEWIGKYAATERAYAQLQACRYRDARCLDQWGSEQGLDFDYVYVAAPVGVVGTDAPSCCREILRSLTTDPGYRLAYESDGASVFERIHTAGP